MREHARNTAGLTGTVKEHKLDEQIVHHVLLLGAKLHASCVQGAAAMAKFGKVMADFKSAPNFARLVLQQDPAIL